MDIAYIRSKDLETTTPILVTNSKDYTEVLPTTKEEVQVGEAALSVK